jgi:hypothetical protein
MINFCISHQQYFSKKTPKFLAYLNILKSITFVPGQERFSDMHRHHFFCRAVGAAMPESGKLHGSAAAHSAGQGSIS